MVALMKNTILVTLFCSALLLLTAGCNRNAVTGSTLNLANYQQVTPGMTKAQVERIMGSPTTFEGYAGLQKNDLSGRRRI